MIYIEKEMKIVIIGASSGIGRELALQYLKKGHFVGVTGRWKWLLEELMTLFPTQTYISTFDVRDPNVLTYLDNLKEAMNGFDILIYNAGVGYPSKDLNLDTEIQTTLINVNGFVAITNYAFNFLQQQGNGHIVVVSSIAGLVGNSWTPAYSASKAFVSNYAESLHMKALRLQIPIAVTDIRPGFVNTKEAEGHNRFWTATTSKAAKQMIRAIEKKKRVAYITKRWWLIAMILKFTPYQLYRRIL
ncbi:MAG TPA: SDR family NAD(P)-dependent oxidoreductase [Flavisolibacter sp.]|nr:SDR family NAD(P)-dependent oxidoreductase [Flavisolibacter sp.]